MDLFTSFSLQKTLIDGLESCWLLVDYWDLLLSAVLTAPIHCRGSIGSSCCTALYIPPSIQWLRWTPWARHWTPNCPSGCRSKTWLPTALGVCVCVFTTHCCVWALERGKCRAQILSMTPYSATNHFHFNPKFLKNVFRWRNKLIYYFLFSAHFHFWVNCSIKRPGKTGLSALEVWKEIHNTVSVLVSLRWSMCGHRESISEGKEGM